MPPLDIVFAGTPEFAAKHLESLIGRHHRLVAAYTQPDRRAGRGKKLLPSPVKKLAESHGIPIKQPPTLKETSAQEELRALQADLLVVVAYGLILPEEILNIPRLGCINVHASLLPSWRGAAPIERALLAGDQETGITIMQMDAGLDTGDMLLRKAVPIEANDTRVTLEQKLASVGVDALAYVLDHIEEVQASASPQDDQQSSYASKLKKEEACIQWQDSAIKIDRQIRAGIGRHPAYCFTGSERMRVLTAIPAESCSAKAGEIVSVDKSGLLVGCGQGGLLITQIQLPGKNPVSIKDLLNARPGFFVSGASLKSAVAAS